MLKKLLPWILGAVAVAGVLVALGLHEAALGALGGLLTLGAAKSRRTGATEERARIEAHQREVASAIEVERSKIRTRVELEHQAIDAAAEQRAGRPHSTQRSREAIERARKLRGGS